MEINIPVEKDMVKLIITVIKMIPSRVQNGFLLIVDISMLKSTALMAWTTYMLRKSFVSVFIASWQRHVRPLYTIGPVPLRFTDMPETV